MKKAIFTALALALAIAATAQTSDELYKARLEFHKRDASQKHLTSSIPLSQQPASQPKDAQGVRMPEGAWFPGEWEEVKAIVTTVYYDYYPEEHVGDQSWYADPLLGGYANIYHLQGSWQQTGIGRYVAIPDTSDQQFSKVFYYLIDAVQLGGAESWVRIEQASDSAIVLRQLERLGLRHDNVKFIVGYGNSFWYRDCGPIAFYYGEGDTIGMMDFMYYPGRALDDSLPHYIEQQMGIRNLTTTIEWEGGNCLVDGAGKVFSSDAIMSGNGDTYGQLTWDGEDPNTINYTSKAPLTRQKVIDSLAHIMGPRGAHLLPAYRYDGGTGHIDLYADMIDENEFIFSVMPEHYANWVDYKTFVKNVDSLLSWQSVHGENYKHHTIPFPCMDNGNPFTNQAVYNSQYTRTYSNHTFVNNVIIQPVFSNVVDGVPQKEWDRVRFDSLRLAYPGYTLYPINVKDFDGSGGAIHCITKQIPADSPIRILHKSVTGVHPELQGEVTFSATITNNTGIAEAKAHYRVDEGAWQEVTLTANGDEYSCTMTLPQVDQCKVDYYIEATSNAGKTITKPMPAAQGGYFTFYYGTNITVGVEQPSEESTLGQFYPNPSTGMASIQIPAFSGQIEVVDMMGREVYRAELSTMETGLISLDTRHFAAGLYHVVFTNGESREVRKLIVK